MEAEEPAPKYCMERGKIGINNLHKKCFQTGFNGGRRTKVLSGEERFNLSADSPNATVRTGAVAIVVISIDH